MLRTRKSSRHFPPSPSPRRRSECGTASPRASESCGPRETRLSWPSTLNGRNAIPRRALSGATLPCAADTLIRQYLLTLTSPLMLRGIPHLHTELEHGLLIRSQTTGARLVLAATFSELTVVDVGTTLLRSMWTRCTTGTGQVFLGQ